MTTDRAQAALTVRDLIHGRWKAQALAVALRLHLPERTSHGPVTVTELARAAAVSPDALSRLLRLLTCLGVMTRPSAGWYALADSARSLLADHPRSLRMDAEKSLSAATAHTWAALPDMIRAGWAPTVQRPSNPVDEASLDAAAAYRAGVLARTLDSVAPAVADVMGSGDRLLLICPGTSHQRLSHGVGGSLVPADPLDADNEPMAADVVLAVHWLREFDDDQVPDQLRRVQRLLSDPGTLLMVVADKRDVGTASLAAYLDVQQLLSGHGRERTLAEYASLLRAGGLQICRDEPIPDRPAMRLLHVRRQEGQPGTGIEQGVAAQT